MSCNCAGLSNAGPMLNGLRGLGQVDPTSAALAIADAKHLWDDLVKALGIGAGRQEADIIVPVQNRIFNGTVTPIVDYLTNIREGKITADCTTLKNDLAALISVEKQWLDYLHQTKWQDGRAATQAEATLEPWFTNAKTELQSDINESCSTIGSIIPDSIGQIFTTPSGGVNWPIIAVAAGAAFMLFRRK